MFLLFRSIDASCTSIKGWCNQYLLECHHMHPFRLNVTGVQPLEIQQEDFRIVLDQVDGALLRLLPLSLHGLAKERGAPRDEGFVDCQFLARIALTNDDSDHGGVAETWGRVSEMLKNGVQNASNS
jgi:hypothetical protein